MKTQILEITAGISHVLENIKTVAQSLPETAINPSYVSTIGGGNIEFFGSNTTTPAVAAAFGKDGWLRVEGHYPGYNYQKRLPNGVVVTINNAEPKPKHVRNNSPVDPSVFEPSTDTIP